MKNCTYNSEVMQITEPADTDNCIKSVVKHY